MFSIGAASCAAVPVSNARAGEEPAQRCEVARAEDRRRQGQIGAECAEHGRRAQKYLVLPDVDAAEFADLEAALVEELAPVGALQIVLARRGAVNRLASGARCAR
jgi:hypothetical protein